MEFNAIFNNISGRSVLLVVETGENDRPVASQWQTSVPGLLKDSPYSISWKFIFRYQDLLEIYSVSAETMINDAFSYSENV
jgi:hypothetical protein